MPTVRLNLPRYVVPKERKSGTSYYFQVPKRLRPEGWSATVRVPIKERERVGGEDEMLAAIRDGKALNLRLDKAREMERRGQQAGPEEGTLPWLNQSYQNDPDVDFASLGKRTKEGYDQAAKKIMLWSKQISPPDPHVSRLDWPFIKQFLDVFSDRPHTKRIVKVYLKLLLDHAVDHGAIRENPIPKNRRARRKKARRTITIWSDELVQLAVDICDRAGARSMGTCILIGMDLMQYPDQIIGMRRGVDYLPETGEFEFERNKTGEPVRVNASRRVRARLAQESELYLIINEETGQPYARRAWNARFRELMDSDERTKGLEFGWLRHSGVVESDRAGLSEKQIADIGGWKSTQSVKNILDSHYRIRDSVVANLGQKRREGWRAKQERERRANR